MKLSLVDKRTLLFMAIPCFLFVVTFSYIPILGWIMAFFNYKPGLNLFQCDFTGLKYFKMAVSDPNVLLSLRNTLAMSCLGIITSPLPIVFAVFLSEIRSKTYKRLVQTFTTLPNFISWVLVFSIFFAMFSVTDGMVNKLLHTTLHWLNQPVNPLINDGAAWFIQTGISIWKSIGFGAIVYLAAISGIDPEMYDAADVDGAGRFKKMWYITFPGLIPTYVTLLLLSIGSLLSNGFEQFYMFYNAMVSDHLTVLDYYLYQLGIAMNNYSLSTAIGISKTLVSVILIMSANYIVKRVRGTAIF